MEVYVSLFFVIVGGVVFSQALSLSYYGEYGPGPGLLPLWASGLLLLLAAINLVSAYSKDSNRFAELIPRGAGLINLLACVGAFLLFMLTVERLGFTVAGIVMLFILFSRGYKMHWALGLPVAVTGMLFFVFSSVLGIPIPVNEYGW